MSEIVAYGDLFTPRTTFRRARVAGADDVKRITQHLIEARVLVIVEPLGGDEFYVYTRKDSPERLLTAAIERVNHEYRYHDQFPRHDGIQCPDCPKGRLTDLPCDTCGLCPGHHMAIASHSGRRRP